MVFKTLVHEISHARLHGEGPASIDRQTAEVQAESIAYTVCAHYGLDTSEYSFGYIAGWSSGKDAKELKDSLEIIRTEAAAIIEKVDEYYPVEYDRWAQEHAQPEIAPAIPVPLNRTDIFSQLLEREDIIRCAAIAEKAGVYEDFVKRCDSVSSQLTGEPHNPAVFDKAAADIAAYYQSIERGRAAAKYDGSMNLDDYTAMHNAPNPPEPENPLRTAELSTEQNENMIDGILNNAPSPGEIAACRQASSPDFQDLRGTLEDCKREAAMSLSSPTERPSVQQRLEQFKVQAAQRAEMLSRTQKNHMEVGR
ncbi:hypothetical protein SDC9_128334 [bioreactor metagenome]|uniref:DUF4316 domain-containing protein n=1 Tax=bioreactor metagenome TaxID=1076179 RepID=A0A645CX50_9ZZZZ